VLIALDGAATLPVDGGIVRNAFRVSAGGNTPGSELRVKVVRPEHPLVYGYETLTAVFRGNGPLFDVAKADRARVVLQFGTKKPEGEEDEAEKKPGAASGIEVEDLDSPGTPAVAKPKEEKKDEGRLVLSGLSRGQDALDGKPAILDLPTGKGRVILYAFNPLHRFLNLADFRFVYNALLNWNDLPQ
jgi:hypothetical protein